MARRSGGEDVAPEPIAFARKRTPTLKAKKKKKKPRRLGRGRRGAPAPAAARAVAPAAPPEYTVDGLTPTERAYWTTAHRIAERLRPDLQEKYGSGVVGIAPGFRTEGPKRRVRRELVIRVYVKKKIKEGRGLPHKKRIPKSFSGYLIKGKGKKRKLVHIPTDVSALGAGEPQCDGIRHLRVPLGAGKVRRGSVCTLVHQQNDPQTTYALTCKHVVPRLDTSCSLSSERSPVHLGKMVFASGPNPHPCRCGGRNRTCVSKNAKADIGKFEAGDVGEWHIDPGDDPEDTSVDAALVRLASGTSVPIANGGFRPEGWTTTDNEYVSITSGLPVFLVTHSGIKEGEVVAAPIDLKLDGFKCGRGEHVLRFDRLIEYDVDPVTIGGDSGSPVYAGFPDDGNRALLIGMHFYYNADEGHGYGLYMGDIVGAFGSPLALA